jgi:hypothetical protein
MPEEQLNGPEIAGAPVDKRCLGSAQRVGPKEMRVEINAGKPVSQVPCILTSCHAAPQLPTVKQKLTRFLTCQSDVGIDGVSGLLRQFKPDGTPCLSLANCRPIHGVAVGRNIIDLYGNNVAASKLAIDRQIEQRQIAR